MTSVVEDVRDAVHQELMGVAAAIKRPDSDAASKNAPDPVTLALIVTKVLIPILTGVASGILTHLATRKGGDAIERRVADLEAQLKALAHRDEPEDEAVVDAIVHTISTLPFDRARLAAAAAEPALATKVAAELRRFHLSEATSARLAPLIITRAIATLSAAAPRQP